MGNTNTNTHTHIRLLNKFNNHKPLFRHKSRSGTVSPGHPQISSYEKKLSEVQKGVLSASDAQRSQMRQAQKAIRTLENKLDRVS